MIIALGLAANIEVILGLAIQDPVIQDPAIQNLATLDPAILGLIIHAPTDVVNVDAGSAMGLLNCALAVYFRIAGDNGHELSD
ncbi:hypothetical protein HZU72_16730 [Halomonas sp. QX-2]|uniref:Uncharacterized protein n=1 Tax=Vreelandella sedimenti TaxID=2729618 RepID=A0A7Z0SNQ6_9GAMM|nr:MULTISPECIES: hypothetical protein [Halomonas]NYT74060.1 hypothetical protein [Halomonas sedimenti]|tara:strand:- start:5005 stop:5253 length:249 start_codon:yes stop_codon:yes gene_type:complete